MAATKSAFDSLKDYGSTDNEDDEGDILGDFNENNDSLVANSSNLADHTGNCNEDKCNSLMSSPPVDLTAYCSKDPRVLCESNKSLAPSHTADEDNEDNYKIDSDISSCESDHSEWKPSSVESFDEDSVDIEISNPKNIFKKRKRKLNYVSTDPESQNLVADILHSPIRLKRAPNCYSTPKRAKTSSNSSISPSNQLPIAPKSHSPSAVSPSDDIIQSYVIGIADKLKEHLKNKEDFEKFLHGNPKGKKKIIDNQVTVQVNTNKSKNKRQYDKPHICIYCGACIIKLSRHFFYFILKKQKF